MRKENQMTKRKAGRPKGSKNNKKPPVRTRIYVQEEKVSIIRLIINNTFPCLQKLKNSILEALK